MVAGSGQEFRGLFNIRLHLDVTPESQCIVLYLFSSINKYYKLFSNIESQ